MLNLFGHTKFHILNQVFGVNEDRSDGMKGGFSSFINHDTPINIFLDRVQHSELTSDQS